MTNNVHTRPIKGLVGLEKTLIRVKHGNRDAVREGIATLRTEAKKNDREIVGPDNDKPTPAQDYMKKYFGQEKKD